MGGSGFSVAFDPLDGRQVEEFWAMYLAVTNILPFLSQNQDQDQRTGFARNGTINRVQKVKGVRGELTIPSSRPAARAGSMKRRVTQQALRGQIVMPCRLLVDSHLSCGGKQLSKALPVPSCSIFPFAQRAPFHLCHASVYSYCAFVPCSSIVDTNFAVGTILGIWPGDKLKGITGREQVKHASCTQWPQL